MWGGEGPRGGDYRGCGVGRDPEGVITEGMWEGWGTDRVLLIQVHSECI